jgi:proteasome beta subunit
MFENRYAPLLTQVILGGVAVKPLVYVLDPLGGAIPDQYASVGTGAEMATAVVEESYTQAISQKEARDLLLESIRAAIQRDAMSGNGVDLLSIGPNGLKEESISL